MEHMRLKIIVRCRDVTVHKALMTFMLLKVTERY